MGSRGLEAGEWVGRKGFWEEGSSKLSFKGSEEVSTVRAGGDGVSSRGLEVRVRCGQAQAEMCSRAGAAPVTRPLCLPGVGLGAGGAEQTAQ